MLLTTDTEVINKTEPGSTGLNYGFCQTVGEAGVYHGGHLEIQNQIHNTDFCCVIEGYVFDAW